MTTGTTPTADPGPPKEAETRGALAREAAWWLARLVPASVAAAAWLLFGAADRFPLAAAEAYLMGPQVFVVLVAVAATHGTRLATAAAFLLGLGAWVLPPTPLRGIAVNAALVLVLALAATHAMEAPARRLPNHWRGRVALFFVWAVALQWLARPDLLLVPAASNGIWRQATLALGLPLVAALALTILTLSRRAGWTLAVVFPVFLVPGITVQLVLVWVALAAGVIAGEGTRPRWQRALAAICLFAPLVKGPAGGLATAAGCILALLPEAGAAPSSAGRPTPPASPAASLASTVFLAAAYFGRFPPVAELAASLLLFVIWMPTTVAAFLELPWRLDTRRTLLVAGFPLVLASQLLATQLDVAAAGAVLIALALPDEGALARLQRLWFVAGGALALMAAGYPWLRATPLVRGLELWRESDGLLASPLGIVLVVVAVVLGLGWAAQRWPRFGVWAPWGLAALGLVGLLSWLPPAGRQTLRDEPLALTTAVPTWQVDLPSRAPTASPWRWLQVDSQLFHGANLPTGQIIGQIVARNAQGQEVHTWKLHAGQDSADWAALREDVRRQPGFAAPPGFLHAVAPDGSFFIPRFRKTLAFPTPGPLGFSIRHLSFERSVDLPPATELALWRIEVLP